MSKSCPTTDAAGKQCGRPALTFFLNQWMCWSCREAAELAALERVAGRMTPENVARDVLRNRPRRP